MFNTNRAISYELSLEKDFIYIQPRLGVFQKAINSWLARQCREFSSTLPMALQTQFSYDDNCVLDLPNMYKYSPLLPTDGIPIQPATSTKTCAIALWGLSERSGRNMLPSVVFSVGYNMRINDVREGARMWLIGSGGAINAVYTIEIQDSRTKGMAEGMQLEATAREWRMRGTEAALIRSTVKTRNIPLILQGISNGYRSCFILVAIVSKSGRKQYLARRTTSVASGA